MNRRDFLVKSSGLLGLPFIIKEIGCSSESDPYSSSNGSDDNGFNVVSSVNSGHSHSLQISYDDVNDPPTSGKTLTTSSSGSHTHQITLSTTDYQDLKDGKTITKDSTNVGNHIHTFSITVPA